MKLTQATAKALSKVGKYGDDDYPGLMLTVAKSRTKSWVLRYQSDGKRRDVTLGRFPAVSVSEARKLATERRAIPASAPARKRMPTFRQAATETFKGLQPTWKPDSTYQTEWLAVLERHVFPHIGDTPVNRIAAPDVLAIVQPLWTAKPATGRNVRQRIRAVLEWCLDHDFVSENVAARRFRGALPPQSYENHRDAVHYDAAPGIMAAIEACPSGTIVRCALHFIILAAARAGEVRFARWDEFDMDDRVWTVPGERMKAGTVHRVPLSDGAIEVLQRVRRLGDGDLVFPMPSGEPMNPGTMLKALRSAGCTATIHGFRSTFTDWAGECTVTPPAVVMRSIAHVVGSKSDRAYARSDLLDRRRELMQAWSDFLMGKEPAAEAA